MITGDICERITTEEDCETAARNLNLSDITAYSAKGDPKTWPPYCYYKPGNPNNRKLFFNTDFNSTASCSSERNCLCKSGKTTYNWVMQAGHRVHITHHPSFSLALHFVYPDSHILGTPSISVTQEQYKAGCYTKLAGFIRSEAILVGGIGISIALLQVFGVVIACTSIYSMQ